MAQVELSLRLLKEVAMEPAGAYQSGPPPARPSPDATESFALLTWPRTVQLALGLIITASIFFLLGRWSQQWSPHREPGASARVGQPLNLNRATKAELRLLPGIGDALAQRIVAHRAEQGPFQSVDDLRRVNGIGPKSLDRLRPWLFVAAGSPVAEEESAFVSTADLPRSTAMSGASHKTKADQLAGPINVNRAGQDELQKLPGIGPKMSQRILEARAKAPFKSIDDLRRVKGIGPKTLDKLRPHVALE